MLVVRVVGRKVFAMFRSCICVLLVRLVYPDCWPILTVLHQGWKIFITGKDTDFLSYQTMGAKLVARIFRFHQDSIGPEGPIIHISALLARWVGKALQEVEHMLFLLMHLRQKSRNPVTF